MSRNVRLPMMCTPACRSVSIVQAVASSSQVLKIQSSSPSGPATKPSTERDIFRINFPLICTSECERPLEKLCGRRRHLPAFAGRADRWTSVAKRLRPSIARRGAHNVRSCRGTSYSATYKRGGRASQFDESRLPRDKLLRESIANAYSPSVLLVVLSLHLLFCRARVSGLREPG